MTTFYWTDTKEEAETDAAEKGLTNWAFFKDKNSIGGRDLLKYDAVYFRTGVNELEKEFVRLASPSWLC